MVTSIKPRSSLASRLRVVPGRSLARPLYFSKAAIPAVGRFALMLTAVILLFLSGRVDTNATVFNADYRLGPMDQVRLKVFEWRAAKDEVFEWAALNAEYSIGPSGRISLPLIGEVAAAGLSVNDLAKSIGQRLQARMGLAEAPDIAVEVSKFRPFYLVGAIDKPGEYAYRPGMTVLQAIAVAGGVTRTGNSTSGRVERELIQTRGDIVMYGREFNALLARRARLDAEVKALDAPPFPVALVSKIETDPIVSTLVAQEVNIFKSRRELFDNQVAQLEQLISYLQAQTKLLEGQIATHDEQVALVKQESQTIDTLVKKGFSTQNRKIALQRNAAQLQGDRLRLQEGLLRVNGDLSRTNIALLDVHAKRITDATAELREVQSKLETIAQRSDVAERLLYESEAVAPILIADRARGAKREPVYKIVRLSGGNGNEINANELTPIEPGDTIKVEMPRADLSQRNMPISFDAMPSSEMRLDPTVQQAPEQRPASRQASPDRATKLVPSSAPMQ